MKIDNSTKMSILYDFYGQLLTEKQSRIFTLYHDDNYSLSEIGDELDVSKQGVHDALKKAEAALEDFETKLGLIKTSRQNEEIIIKIKALLAKLSARKDMDAEAGSELNKIEENIDKLKNI